MNIRSVALALSLAMGLSTADSRANLWVGDPAPALAVMEWIKGEPVTAFKPGQVYVVEFWATWCAPCIAEMPRLSELARQHAAEVIVVGVNAREKYASDGTVATVKKFVDKQGDRMSYRVAMDNPDKNTMFNAWMEAAGLHGVPMAFIVDRAGRIAWVGHATELDKPLAAVLAGTQNLAANRAAQKRDQKERQDLQLYNERMAILQPALDRKDYPEIVAESDKLTAKDPLNEVITFDVKLKALSHVDESRALAFVQEKAIDTDFLKRFAEWNDGPDLHGLNGYWVGVGQVLAAEDGLSDKSYQLAARVLSKDLNRHPDRFYVWQSLAQARFRLHDRRGAISALETAIRKAEADQPPDDLTVKSMRATLETYRAAQG